MHLKLFTEKYNITSKVMERPEIKEMTSKSEQINLVKDNWRQYNHLADEEEFNKYISKLQAEARYNPRLDLKEDSKLWQAVLRIAEERDRQLYGVLHGFRCAGCRLKIAECRLKLLPAIGPDQFWKNDKEWLMDRREWLIPYQKEIVELFNRAMEEIN